MTKVRCFFMLHFQFLGPWDAHRLKIQVDQGLWQVSRSCSTPIESSNYQFESSKNNVLLLLRPMDENPDDMNKFYVSLFTFIGIQWYEIHRYTVLTVFNRLIFLKKITYVSGSNAVGSPDVFWGFHWVIFMPISYFFSSFRKTQL